MIVGKQVAYIQKFWQNFHPECKTYIKLHISSVSPVISFDSSLQYQLIGTKRNPWVAVNLQSPFIYSNEMPTLLLTLQLCYWPLAIKLRVIKNK